MKTGLVKANVGLYQGCELSLIIHCMNYLISCLRGIKLDLVQPLLWTSIYFKGLCLMSGQSQTVLIYCAEQRLMLPHLWNSGLSVCRNATLCDPEYCKRKSIEFFFSLFSSLFFVHDEKKKLFYYLSLKRSFYTSSLHKHEHISNFKFVSVYMLQTLFPYRYLIMNIELIVKIKISLGRVIFIPIWVCTDQHA